MRYNHSFHLPPPIYSNPSWLDSMKDSENYYDLIQSIDEEYIRGVESISITRSTHFFLESPFPILSGYGQQKTSGYPGISGEKINL